MPALAGIEGQNVVTALEVLAGRKDVGQKVAVVGGGAIGCETAEYLQQSGKQVTILEMLDDIGKDVSPWNRWVVLDRLSDSVRVQTGVKVEEISAEGIKATGTDGAPLFFEVDSAVIAVGMRPVDSLANELKGKVASLHVVGDCAKLGKIRDAIAGGFQAALEI